MADFRVKESYRLRDGVEVSVAAVTRFAGYTDRAGWWDSLSPSEKFWFASEFAKQRGKRNK